MSLSYWDMANAKKLATFYNQQINDIPYCYAVDAEELQQDIELLAQPQAGDVWCQQLVVAQEQDMILGFIHLAFKSTPEQLSQGYIRFFSYRHGQRRIGQQLLDAGEQYLRAAGVHTIYAFLPHKGYSFYHMGRGFLVDRWAHVYAMLGINKYQIHDAQILMEKKLVQECQPTLPMVMKNLACVIEVEQNELVEITIQLREQDQIVGNCVVRVLKKIPSNKDNASPFYIVNLWVCRNLEAKGLEYYLMDRLHWEMFTRGYDHALIGTALDNYQEQLLYAKNGYTLVLTEYSFAKALSQI